jgi:hypothetical protein
VSHRLSDLTLSHLGAFRLMLSSLLAVLKTSPVSNGEMHKVYLLRRVCRLLSHTVTANSGRNLCVKQP